MKRYLLLPLLLLASLLLIACDSEEQEAEELEQPPNFYLLDEGSQIGAAEGVYCWLEDEGDTFDPEEAGGIGEVCENEAPPRFSDSDFVVLPAGEPIAIEMEAPLPDRVTLALTPPEEIVTEDSYNEISIDDSVVTWEAENVPAGDYVLSVLGFWRDAGGAVYYFPVTLE